LAMLPNNGSRWIKKADVEPHAEGRVIHRVRISGKPPPSFTALSRRRRERIPRAIPAIDRRPACVNRPPVKRQVGPGVDPRRRGQRGRLKMPLLVPQPRACGENLSGCAGAAGRAASPSAFPAEHGWGYPGKQPRCNVFSRSILSFPVRSVVYRRRRSRRTAPLLCPAATAPPRR